MASITLKKTFAALPRTERGKAVRLTGDPNGKNVLYCNGNSVYIRNLKDPSTVDIYTEHAKPTTVARYSPNKGFYIASCDIGGKIRIWDTVNPEHVLKKEYQVLAGEIRDIAWDSQGQKIAVCGAGRDKFAHVFNMETGTSVGVVGSHQKTVNTISYHPKGKLRIVTASEDFLIGLHEGPPFKFKKHQNKHTNFANVARYSNDGDVVLSGGGDGRLFRYDGVDLEQIGEIGSESNRPHKGGIYEICFSPDNTEFVTASGDKTAKIFKVQAETPDPVCEFNMGKRAGSDWRDMQLGCLWQGDEIVTINGYGHIIYHDRNNPDQPKRVVKGHMKPITTIAVSEDKGTAFTAGQEGIIYWDANSGDNDAISGKGHSSEVTDIVVDGDNLFSIGIDDTLRVSSVSGKKFSDVEMKLDSQPRKIDSRNGTVVVACMKHVIVLQAGAGLTKKSAQEVKLECSAVSIHPSGSAVAVGFKEGEVRIYSLQGGALTEQKVIKLEGEVSCLAYSPDGASLAYSNGKRVGVRSATDYEVIGREREWHTARVICLSWSPDGQKFATGGLDSLLCCWKTDMGSSEKMSIKAHTMSHINKLAWLDTHTVITAGQDSNVKQFTVSN